MTERHPYCYVGVDGGYGYFVWDPSKELPEIKIKPQRDGQTKILAEHVSIAVAALIANGHREILISQAPD